MAKESAMTYQVGIIGCGKPWRSEGATGFGMSNAHARGYNASPDCKIVALADISEENASAFQAQNGGDRIYTNYHEMLAQEQLDIVSISTWPHLHAEMVIAAAEAGVKAIHCEKPMAPTYGEARRMVAVCEANGVQLTFNHQRRFGLPFRKAKELLKSGAIGNLERLEATCDNLFDWGTHWFDMLCYYNDECDLDWVIGQIDARGSKRIFGVLIESQGISQFKYKNGVMGLLTTGDGADRRLSNRLIGSDGLIDLVHEQGWQLRMWGRGDAGWRTIETGETVGDLEYVQRGVLDLVDALKTGREPELSGRRALRATELIFATYESSRRRGRVDLPLEIEDSPLVSMVEAGEIPM
jgi:UDP-N-acetylglucosamine 3-dehydrogenase